MKDNGKMKFKIHKMLSALTALAGFLLMAFMIIVESEPSAIPLLLIVIGAAWYLTTRARMRKQK